MESIDYGINQSANIFILVKDLKSNFISCNEASAEMLGFDSPKLILGKTIFDLFANQKIANLYQSYDRQVLTQGAVVNQLLPPIALKTSPSRSSGIPSVSLTLSQTRNRQGKTTGLIVYCVGVTHEIYNYSPEVFQFDTKSKRYIFYLDQQQEYFTQREYDVFKILILGATTKEIAKKLMLSPRTIEDFIEKIRLKLQCVSKHQIIETAMRMGILHRNEINSISV